jgi:hypothetical protein
LVIGRCGRDITVTRRTCARKPPGPFNATRWPAAAALPKKPTIAALGDMRFRSVAIIL